VSDVRREKGANKSLYQAARVKRWRKEKAKMRTMISEKKKKCWQIFC